MFVVYYSLIGSRTNGSYLVNTKTKKEARKVFKNKYDGDYRPVIDVVLTTKEYWKEYGEEDETENVFHQIPPENDMVLLEAGT